MGTTYAVNCFCGAAFSFSKCTHRRELLEILDGELFDSVVVSLMGGESVIRERIEALGVQVYSLDMWPGRPTPAAVWRLVRRVHQLRPNLIQGWMSHGNLATILAATSLLRQIPIVWSAHRTIYDLKADKKLAQVVIRVLALLSAWPERIT